MRGRRSNPAELYKAASFGLAWSAGIATVLFAFFYFWLQADAPAGWFNDFLVSALPGAAVAPEVIAFAPHPRDLGWAQLLDGASSATIVARWFDAWSNENRNALGRFFERGGVLETVMLGPYERSGSGGCRGAAPGIRGRPGRC